MILNPYTLALIELLFAAMLWGFGFIATRWALVGFSPLWLTAIRFMIVCFFALPLLFKLPIKKFIPQMKQAFWPGIFLGLTLIFQTWGLQYTSVTKSGFITCLYIVMIPITESFLLKQHVSRRHYFFVFLALLGTALISQLDSGDLNFGDFLTFICAILATLQIISIEKVAKKIESPFRFNLFQSFWAGLFPLILAVFFEPLHFEKINSIAIIGMLFLSLCSTMIAFLIQIRTQKILSPSLVSMLFLLESPFAAFFAYFIFGEILSLTQWIGASIIFMSAFGTLLGGNHEKSKKKENSSPKSS